MKTIRRKVIFVKRNHVRTSYMKFMVLIIYVLPQCNAVRIYKIYRNNLTV